MKNSSIVAEASNKVVLSNQIGDYPPYNLTKIQYQALLTLVAYIDSKSKPVYGIDDLKDEIKRLQIPKELHMQYVEQVVKERNTYRVPASEVLRYFTAGDTPRGGVIKRVLDAILSLNNYKIKSRHPDFDNADFEGAFSWFDTVGYDKKKDEIVFIIGLTARKFLLGLGGGFLQMLAESTMRFDGKYSVPIFMYMKRKIFNGHQEFHGQESVEEFRKRFGLDGIKTYDRFYELERRILKVAEEDSRKSGDISFTFKGIPERGSRKVTILKYHIYRIGNIHKPLNAQEEIIQRDIQEQKLQQVLELSKARKIAYDFLVKKGVNRHFILDHILPHEKLTHTQIKGYEDLFFELMWTRFSKATKARKLAGAFVSWWKKGIILRDNHFWAVMEQLYQHQKKMQEGERMYRKVAHEMTLEEYERYREQVKQERKDSNTESTPSDDKIDRQPITVPMIELLPKRAKTPFSLALFKLDYPQDYLRICQEVELAFSELKPSLELVKYNQMVANRVAAECERFYNRS